MIGMNDILDAASPGGGLGKITTVSDVDKLRDLCNRQAELIEKLNKKLVECETELGRINAVLSRVEVTRP